VCVCVAGIATVAAAYHYLQGKGVEVHYRP
jgi:hypothetical protein